MNTASPTVRRSSLQHPSFPKGNPFERHALAAARARTAHPGADRTPRERSLIALDDRRLAARSRGRAAYLNWFQFEIDSRERKAIKARRWVYRTSPAVPSKPPHQGRSERESNNARTKGSRRGGTSSTGSSDPGDGKSDLADWRPADPDFFTERGIIPQVAASRPYGSWTAENPEPLHEEWDPFVSRGQRGWITRVAKQSDGLLIPRYAPPGLDLPPISAEIRPLKPVETRPEYYQQDRQARGLERKRAKYIHCPTPPEIRDYWHDHADIEPEGRAKHIERKHGGQDIRGPHPHTYKVKDKSKGQGRRIDMHPLAVPLFETADRVYFVIEGCPKADAILSHILQLGRREAVLSVPSIGQWDARELPAVAEMFLMGKEIIIVPDADAREKPEVLLQAMLLRSHLRRRLGLKAQVALPPLPPDAERDPNTGKPVHNGVDDLIGAGGTVDDLQVIRREMPATFEQWIEDQKGRPDRLLRDADVLQNVALLAEDDGKICRSVEMFAKIMGTHHSRVSRGLGSLVECGALTIEGSLLTRPPTRKRGTGGRWYRTEEAWEERPTITVVEELRAVELEPIRLGDLDRDVLQQLRVTSTQKLQAVIRRRGRPEQVPAVAA